MLATVRWSQGIEDAWSKLITFVPKLLGALAVLIIGLLIARAIRAALRKVVRAARVDEHLAKTPIGKSLAKNKLSAGDLLVRVAYVGLVLLVAQMAIGTLGPSPIATALNSMMAFIPKIVVALIIVLLTGFVVDKVTPIVRDTTRTKSYSALATKATSAALWLIGGFAALDQIQVARNVVDTLFRTVVASLGAILVIKFGVGGIWAARDRFWPRVYDSVSPPKQQQPQH